MAFVSLAIIALVAFASPFIASAIPGKPVPETVFLLVLGAVLGPHMLGVIHVDAEVSLVSELGLAFLFLLAGFEGTVKVALTAGAIALVLGLALMLGRTSDIKPLQLVCRVLTDFFRGVPSLLFIYFFFLVLPQYKIALPSFWMLTLPVALAAAGVLAEIFRAGVNAVPRGQVEAAQALGLSKAKITFKIVLPQAIRFIIPSLISQLVVVVKDTTVAYVVSYPDLMQNARVLITNYDALVSVYLVIAVIYILINVAINKAAVYVSHKTGATIIR